MSQQLLIALLTTASVLALLAGARVWRLQRTTTLPGMLDPQANASSKLREFELGRPWYERLLKPLVHSLRNVGRALTPSRNLQQLQRDLIMAGMSERWSVADFLGLRFLMGTIFAAAALPLTSALGDIGTTFGLSFACFLIGLYAPNIWLRVRVQKRQHLIRCVLPDVMDLMSICMDAGLGFEAAIQKVAFQWDNPLSLELRRYTREIQLGVSRVEALRHLVDRTGVREVANFVAVLVQANQLGISIRDVLHTQSKQMRVQRRQRAEEAAQKAPLKMLLPMVVFIFPAMFAVILGPAIPRIAQIFR